MQAGRILEEATSKLAELGWPRKPGLQDCSFCSNDLVLGTETRTLHVKQFATELLYRGQLSSCSSPTFSSVPPHNSEPTPGSLSFAPSLA